MRRSRLARQLCGNEKAARRVATLSVLFEKAVKMGRGHCEKGIVSPEEAPEVLGDDAAPIIWKILEFIDRDAYGRVRRIDERTIWLIYWDMQNNPAKEKMSLFELLIALNQNSYVEAILM